MTKYYPLLSENQKAILIKDTLRESTILNSSKTLAFNKHFGIICNDLNFQLNDSVKINFHSTVQGNLRFYFKPINEKHYSELQTIHASFIIGDNCILLTLPNVALLPEFRLDYFSLNSGVISLLNIDGFNINSTPTVSNVISPSFITLCTPNHIGPVEPMFSQTNKNTKGAQICTMHNCFAFSYGQSFYVVDHNYNFISELSTLNSQQKKLSSSDILGIIKSRKLHKVGKKTLSIFTPGSDVYYHWLLDTLPKLEIYKQFNQENTVIEQIIAFDFTKQFQKKSIVQLGFTADQLITPNEDLVYNFNQLDVVQYTALFQEEFAIKFLRNHFLKGESQTSNRKLLISRNDVNRRKLTNEAEVFEKLKPYGFEPVSLSGLSLGEQAILFNSAETIIGVHGANLTNLIFCKPKCKVIELYSQHIMPGYWSICTQLNLNYYVMPDQIANTNINHNKPIEKRRYANLNVDVEALLKLI